MRAFTLAALLALTLSACGTIRLGDGDSTQPPYPAQGASATECSMFCGDGMAASVDRAGSCVCARK